MGQRGPKPKPTAVKKADGNPGKRPLPETEATPPSGDLVMPFELDDIGTQVWNDAIKAAPKDLLTPCDAYVLWQYCQAWSDFKTAEALVEEYGEIAVSEKGSQYQHPAVGIKNKAGERIARLGALIGWSPSNRVGLTIDNTNKNLNPLMKIINGKGRITAENN